MKQKLGKWLMAAYGNEVTGKWLKEVAQGSAPVKQLRKWMKEAADDRGQCPGKAEGSGPPQTDALRTEVSCHGRGE